MLFRSKKLYHNWIVPGHVEGVNTHNISLTINYHEHEKEAIKRWMIENKDSYYGISLIPYDGGDYKYLPYSQPPHPEVFEILDKAFLTLAPLGRELSATERVVQLAKRLGLKAEPTINPSA